MNFSWCRNILLQGVKLFLENLSNLFIIYIYIYIYIYIRGSFPSNTWQHMRNASRLYTDPSTAPRSNETSKSNKIIRRCLNPWFLNRTHAPQTRTWHTKGKVDRTARRAGCADQSWRGRVMEPSQRQTRSHQRRCKASNVHSNKSISFYFFGLFLGILLVAPLPLAVTPLFSPSVFRFIRPSHIQIIKFKILIK